MEKMGEGWVSMAMKEDRGGIGEKREMGDEIS
jgi:hypothetical protein